MVEEDCIDLHDAIEIFEVVRAVYFSSDRAHFLDEHRDKFKPDLVWNIEQGLKIDADKIARAERARGALYHRAATFFEVTIYYCAPPSLRRPSITNCAISKKSMA